MVGAGNKGNSMNGLASLVQFADSGGFSAGDNQPVETGKMLRQTNLHHVRAQR